MKIRLQSLFNDIWEIASKWIPKHRMRILLEKELDQKAKKDKEKVKKWSNEWSSLNHWFIKSPYRNLKVEISIELAMGDFDLDQAILDKKWCILKIALFLNSIPSSSKVHLQTASFNLDKREILISLSSMNFRTIPLITSWGIEISNMLL